MSHPVAVTTAFLNRILGLLAPLFLAATGGNLAAARDAVSDMLANYDIRNDNELRLVALTIAFGFGALDALGQAVNPDLSLNQIIRLRGNATALSRASHQNQAVLDRQRKQTDSEPAPEPEPELAEPLLPASTATPDLIAFARSGTSPRPQLGTATPAPAVSQTRQQRREAERRADKARRRQEHEARMVARSTDTAGDTCPLPTDHPA